MNKSSKITASELVLSTIFFLQRKNGVTAKDITKFICEKRGCRQSQVRSEVKRALERATENGIFCKRRGLYRIESGFGRNKISIKVKGTSKGKRMRRAKRSRSVRPTAEDPFMDAVAFSPVDVPRRSFSRKASLYKHAHPHAIMLSDEPMGKTSVKGIAIEQMAYQKNAYDDDDDDDEDFLEEEDDEDSVDYFADDQFPDASDALKDYPEQEKKKDGKRKAQSRSKSRTKGKTKRRKLSKPRKKTCKRRRTSRKKKPRVPETTIASDSDLQLEYIENEGSKEDDDENMGGDSHGEDNDNDDESGDNRSESPVGSEEENEEDNEEGNNDQEEYNEYGPEDYMSEDDYVNQQETGKQNEGNDNSDGSAKKTEDTGKKEPPPAVTTNVKVSQNNNNQGKVGADSAPTTPVTVSQKDAGNQHSPVKKSQRIRSSSLFRSFKKKAEAKNSGLDRKQLKSRM